MGIKSLNDGLYNVVANLGTARDKAAHSSYYAGVMSNAELMQMYRGSWIARAAVDVPAEDSIRKWRSWIGENDTVSRIEAIEKRLYLKSVLQSALISARLFGGSAIYINSNGDPSTPLTIDGDITSLIVLGRNQLRHGEIVKDINSEFYGWPESFTLNSQGEEAIIHTSRLILLNGSSLPAGSLNLSDTSSFWGDSVLQSSLDAITQCDSCMANISSLIFEANVDVFRFQGYSDLLSDSSNDAAVTRRLSLQAAMKGINGAVVIDKEDEYEKKSPSFASLPELMTKYQENVAGAISIPVTRLFGRSAAGLSGSGDGDERVYFDRIGYDQASVISPAIEFLDKKILTMANAEEGTWYEWNPLRQVSESERAEIFSKTAGAARSLAGAMTESILPIDALSDALVNELMAQGVLPGLDVAIEKYGTLGEQDDL